MLRVEQVRGAASDINRALDQIPRFQNSLRIDRSDYDVDSVFLETLEFSELRDRQEFSIDEECVEALPLSPARDIGVKSFARFYQWSQNLERATFHGHLQLFHDRGETLFLDREIAIGTELGPCFREEEAQEMVNLGHGGDGRLATAARNP
jgi:hypothetical protein